MLSTNAQKIAQPISGNLEKITGKRFVK